MGYGPACTDQGLFPRSQFFFTAQKISRESIPEHHVIFQLLILPKLWLGRERGFFRGCRGLAPWPHSSLACPLVLKLWDDLRDPEAADLPWGSELRAKWRGAKGWTRSRSPAPWPEPKQSVQYQFWGYDNLPPWEGTWPPLRAVALLSFHHKFTPGEHACPEAWQFICNTIGPLLRKSSPSEWTGPAGLCELTLCLVDSCHWLVPETLRAP